MREDFLFWEQYLFLPDDLLFIEVNERDVLSQRGGLGNSHPGTRRYLEKVEEARPEYRALGNRESVRKTAIARSVIEDVHGWGGRFLKKDESGIFYCVMAEDDVLEKVKRALRPARRRT